MRVLGNLFGARKGGFGRLLILAYSRAGSAQAPASQAGPEPGRDAVDVDEFTWQMEQIAARYQPIVLSRLMGHLGGKKPLTGPQICVCLQPDSRDSFRATSAVLRRVKLPATCFVAFDAFGAAGQDVAAQSWSDLNWDDVRELADAGADIGHLMHAGPKLAVMSSSQRRSQLSALRSRVSLESGNEVHAFAYSGDGTGADKSLLYDAAIAGFSLGVSDAVGINALRPISPLTLRRTSVAPDLTRAGFASLLDALERGD